MSDTPAISAMELARRLGGTVEGEPRCMVSEVATLDQAGPQAVSWLASPHLLPQLKQCQAGIVLMPETCTAPFSGTIIRVADPDVSICEALRILAPLCAGVVQGIHPTADVDPTARVEGAAIGAFAHVGAHAVVGPGTKLFPGVYVGEASVIGRDCILWPHVVIRERITLGNRVIIHPNSTIGADGFGYLQRDGQNLKIPQTGTVVIEDDVEIGANSAIDRARSGITRIGRGTKIDNLVQIAHNVEIGDHCLVVAHCAVGGSTKLGKQVVLGGQTGVGDHHRIGDGVQVAAKASVLRNVPAGEKLQGIPAIDRYQYRRQQASLRKIPQWIQRVRELTKRIERLEEQAFPLAKPDSVTPAEDKRGEVE